MQGETVGPMMAEIFIPIVSINRPPALIDSLPVSGLKRIFLSFRRSE